MQMIKEYSATLIRNLIFPSMRLALKETVVWLREQLGRACFWRWEIVRLPHPIDSPYDILFAGRRARRDLAKAIFGMDGGIDTSKAGANLPRPTAFVSDMPIPGALRVPGYVITIIPLGQPLAELTATYDKKLRQLLRNHRAHYHTQQALDDADINCADLKMLQPYASARRGDGAVQLQPDEVRRMAKKEGRLDILYLGDEAVGCHLGYALSRAGKRYWVGLRVGFIEAVFADSKRLHEANSINNYLALEWAIENGFDYYDNGTCLGRPDDGLLQWKRRRGGAVATTGNTSYLYVRLPTVGAAQFLWDSPLFVVERNNLTLHLGLPEGPSDEEVASRYREMGFGGLSKIYLHYARPPGDRLLETLGNLYRHQKIPPIVTIIPAN